MADHSPSSVLLHFAWRPLWASASLVLRTHLRQPAIWIALGLIPLLTWAIPTLLGSHPFAIEGEMRALFGYTVYAVSAALMVIVLTIACATFSHDVQTNRLTLTLTKPLSRTALWFGRWLGCALLATLLVGDLVLSLIAATLYIPDLPRGQTVSHPQLPPRIVRAQETYDLFLKHNILAKTVDKEQALRELARKEPMRYKPLDPEERRPYTFDLATLRAAQSDATHATLRLPANGVLGVKRALTVSISLADQSYPLSFGDNQWVTQSLPLADLLASDGHLTIERQDNDPAATFLFREELDLVLLTPGISYTHNAMRYGYALWTLLLAIAAAGITLGALFSLPVALFTGLINAIILYAASSDYTEVALATRRSTTFAQWCVAFGRSILAPIKPYIAIDPLNCLIIGEKLTLTHLATLTLWHVGALVILFAIPGIWALCKRPTAS